MYIYIFISKVTYNAFRVYILYTVYAFHEIRTHKLGVASIMLHCLSYRNKIFVTSVEIETGSSRMMLLVINYLHFCHKYGRRNS